MTGNEGEPRPRYDTATGRRIVGYDPHTGQPILEAPPSRRLLDKNNVIAGIGVGAIALVWLLVSVSGGGSGGFHKLSGVVQGDMVGAGNIGTGNALTWSNVFCGWEGDHVEVHADLTDGLPTDPVQKVSETSPSLRSTRSCCPMAASSVTATASAAEPIAARWRRGRAVAVLGCGVDVVYPRSNRAVFEQIRGAGLLLSEYRLAPAPPPGGSVLGNAGASYPSRFRINKRLSLL